jgi:uncharacterized protein (TIGR03032 family)
MRFRVPPSKIGPGLNKPKDSEIMVSDGFDGWLRQNKVSLAITDKQGGLLYFIGVGSTTTGISINKVVAPGAGSLWSDGHRLWLSTKNHLHGFVKTKLLDGYKLSHIMTVNTGPLNIQDMVLDSDGRPVYTAANANCLATVDYTAPFKKIWQPGFLADNLKHNGYLSGMAHDGKQIRYVTIFNCKAGKEGWQADYEGAGAVLDIIDNRIVTRNLTLPNSPTFYRGNIWLLNSGSSELGVIESKTGKFLPVFKCPGYPTSLTFHGKQALIGISSGAFGLTPTERGPDEGLQPCGLILINIDKARIVHWIRFKFDNIEVAGVACLPNTTMPISMTIRQED